jgi:hypothetical protein
VAVLKWLGFLLVAASVGVLPFTIWISNDWGFLSALAGLIGLVLLGIALPRRRADPGGPADGGH